MRQFIHSFMFISLKYYHKNHISFNDNILVFTTALFIYLFIYLFIIIPHDSRNDISCCII